MLSDSTVSSQKCGNVKAITSIHRMNSENRGGFTLLEILLAIFIFTIVLSTLYTAYTGTFRNIDETEAQAEIYRMARIALERIVEDLESAYISPWTMGLETEEKTPKPAAFVGENTDINERHADTLRFNSRAHLVFDEEEKEATVAQIVYDVRQSEEEEEGFALYRSDTLLFEERPGEGVGGLVLCDGLHAVNFTYYDAEGQQYDRWDSAQEEFKDRLPVMVSIVLEFLDKRNPEAPLKFTTAAVLPMAAEGYEKAL